MKKAFCMILAVLMVLCSCGGIALAEEQPVELTWFLNASALPESWDMSQPIFKAITEATGVTINMTIPAEDADTKLNLMIASGKLPDMITMNNADLIHELTTNDMVWDLGEFMTTYLPDSDFLARFPEDIKAGLISKYGGWSSYPSHMVSSDAAEIWGYPDSLRDYYTNMVYSDQFSIFVYKDYAEQLGIDVKSVDTEEKLLDLMKQFADAKLKNGSDASVYTVIIPSAALEEMNMRPLKYQFGTMPWDEEGNYRSEYFADEYRHAVEFLNKCYQLGYLDESVMTMDTDTMKTICNSGRAAIYIGGISGLNMGHDDEWLTPGPVQSSTGASPVFPLSSKVGTGWLQTFVTKNCQHPEAVARFIDYMSSREGMLIHMYGIEGEDYYWDDEGMLHRTEQGSSKVEDKVSGMYGFYAFHNISFSRSVEYVDLSNVTDLMTALGSSEKTYKYDSSVLTLPAGYVEAGSDYAFIKNEADTYVQSTLGKIITAKDDETFNSMFDAFLQQLDALGLHDYDAYVNIAVQENAAAIGLDLKEAQPGK